MTDNLLAVEVRKENIPESEALVLQNSFMPFFQKAEAMKEQAMALNVTSADQFEDIKNASDWGEIAYNIRRDTEKIRISLKAESLRKGKAIDGMANIIKYMIVPIEEHLEKQKKFVEIQKAKARDVIREKRSAELVALNVDVTIYSSLGEMPEETYAKLLESSSITFNLMKEAAQTAENERIAKEKADLEARESMRIENERLKKESEARQVEADKERAAKEKAEKLLREKEEEDKRAAKEAARKVEEARENEKQAQRAPDKEKLLALADMLSSIIMPDVKSPEAKEIVTKAVDLLSTASKYVKTQALSL